MASKKDTVPIDVTWVDQQNICLFSRLHRQLLHLRRRESTLTADLEKVDDAATEALISDSAQYVFGECFIAVDPDECGELLEEERGRLAEELAGVQAELAALGAAMEKLKAELYAKFGSQIYLEDQ